MPASKPPTDDPWSYDFRYVLGKELARVGDPTIKDSDPIVRAHRKQLLGLAFSGGGIRSATFNLGVLQAITQLGLLRKFDYLSTVSGGGYVGSWLMAWIKRRGAKDVERALRPERYLQPGSKEPEEIRFLRRFSNYLTPKLGWLGADMWTVIAVYLRNLILNLLVLAAAFAVLLLLPRIVAKGSLILLSVPSWILGSAAAFFLVLAAFNIVRSLRRFVPRRRDATKPVPLPDTEWITKGGYAFYATKLFDRNFILHVDFRIKAKGVRFIKVWVPTKRGKINGEAAARIRISDEGIITPPQADRFPTGEINSQEAARRAEVCPGLNRLEIICADGRCTVRINDLTVNALRVRLKKVRGIWRWRTGFAIGLEENDSAIEFVSPSVQKLESASDTGSTQGQVQRYVIIPLFLAAFLATGLFGFGNFGADSGQLSPAVALVVPMRAAAHLQPLSDVWVFWKWALFAGLGCFGLVFALRAGYKILTSLVQLWSWFRDWVRKKGPSVFRSRRPAPLKWPVENDPSPWTQILGDATSIGFAAAVGGLVSWWLYAHVFFNQTVWAVTVWGTPALIGAFFITIVFHIGFMGRYLEDERREWWSRLNAWLLIYALAWVALFGLALYTPLICASGAKWLRGAATIGWITTTVSGLIAARSSATGGARPSRLTELIATIAPYIFVVGFFLLLSWVIDAMIPSVVGGYGDLSSPFKFWDGVNWNWWRMDRINGWYPIVLVLGLSALIAVVLSLRLDINQFSMHMLYRNRLGRCYLGASNELRRAQPFTGFSPDDDFKLIELACLRFRDATGAIPFPIINAALNLVGGQELAWQQRKGASFVFTPLFCGYDFPEQPPGYCPTRQFAGKPSAISLATAMAISGAAASPNMGYHTSPAPAFLMTVFNVRLGWWLGNPRKEGSWEKSGPLNVLWRLICELFGLTSEEGKYIYLSDGGHFENLGIYELVRRRCRFVVACDAEEDQAFAFGGLGNAIEKCRSDFGIDIVIDVEPIRRRSNNGHSEWHCAMGRIRYSQVDRDAQDGILVYLKSSLTGDEPTDVLRYAATNPGFPHQSTGDQWFDESQFESYRALGFHVARDFFDAIGGADRIATLTKEQLFVELAENWFPPSAATSESFSKHAEAIIAIYKELRENDDLAFLSRDIYPEWRLLFKEEPLKWSGLSFQKPEISRSDLPSAPSQLKAGFYICTAMSDLFEAVYIDLNLEKEFDHPDNRGWMNFFRHWASAPMFRVTWLIGASNYGARFQSFCKRHLELEMGCAQPIPLKARDPSGLTGEEKLLRPKQIEVLAETMVETVWSWTSELRTGSEVLARAALEVSQALSADKLSPRRVISEETARKTAKDLVGAQLKVVRNPEKGFKSMSREKDELWYRAATLLEFVRCDALPPDSTLPARVAELALIHGASIADCVLSTDCKTILNPTEREVVELFFIFNPDLAASAEIIRFGMTPQKNAACLPRGDENLVFPFAFAILANTHWPPEVPQQPKLVYLRVQNHLRRMGLARKGLRALLGDRPGLEIDLQPMHPDADEFPTHQDYARLRRIFGSVQSELAQENLAAKR